MLISNPILLFSKQSPLPASSQQQMEKTWSFPKKYFTKINTHAISFPQPLPNGNTNGIGIVLRDYRGAIILMVSGSIPAITERAAELWALLLGLKCAFYEGKDKLEIETDNEEAAKEWIDWRWFIDRNHEGVIQQLLQRDSDPNLTLDKVKTVIPNQNRLARFLAVDGAHNRSRLVAYRRPFGMVRELWRLDMGLGPVDARFVVLDEAEYEGMQVEEAEGLDVQDLEEMLGENLGDIVIGLPAEGVQVAEGFEVGAALGPIVADD